MLVELTLNKKDEQDLSLESRDLSSIISEFLDIDREMIMIHTEHTPRRISIDVSTNTVEHLLRLTNAGELARNGIVRARVSEQDLIDVLSTLDSPQSSLNQSTAEQLAEECHKHQSKPKNQGKHCLELFRRAIVYGCEASWKKIWDQFGGMFKSWIYDKLNGAEKSQPNVEDVLHNFVVKVIGTITAENFSDFSNLGGLLAYLKRTATTTVIDWKRKQEPFPKIPIEFDIDLKSYSDKILEKQIDDQTMARRILEQVVEERETLVFESLFVYDLKPQEIYKANPTKFNEIKEIHQIRDTVLKRIKRQLQKELIFISLFVYGLNTEDIHKEYPGLFTSIEKTHQIRDRIIRRIKKQFGEKEDLIFISMIQRYLSTEDIHKEHPSLFTSIEEIHQIRDSVINTLVQEIVSIFRV